MKTLFLIRHAAAIQSADLQDFDRPLSEAGIAQLEFMAPRLAEKISSPDLILASPALRTEETSKYFAEALEYAVDKIKFENAMYDATLGDLIAVLQNLPDEVHSAVLVGHNPGMTLLANSFLRSNSPLQLGTCSFCGFDLLIENWNAVLGCVSKQICYEFPSKS